MSLLLKDPAATIDYAIDWRSDYLEEGDRLETSAWLVMPEDDGGAAIVAADHDDGEARATVAGGIAGRRYRLINTVTTARGRTDRRSLTIRIEPR